MTLLLLVSTEFTSAQAAAPLPQAPATLDIGQAVWMTTPEEPGTKGIVVSVSATDIGFKVLGEIRTIPWVDVIRIETTDAYWNGSAAGAIAGGFAFGMPAALFGSTRTAMTSLVVGAGLGIAVGAFLDSLREGRRQLYAAPASAVIAPHVSSGALGIGAILRW